MVVTFTPRQFYPLEKGSWYAGWAPETVEDLETNLLKHAGNRTPIHQPGAVPAPKLFLK